MRVKLNEYYIRKAIIGADLFTLFIISGMLGRDPALFVNDSPFPLRFKRRVLKKLFDNTNEAKRALMRKEESAVEANQTEQRMLAVRELRMQMQAGRSCYTKIPFAGPFVLYFCSPEKGISDRDKIRSKLRVKDNEAFIGRLIDIAERWYYER